MSKISIRTHELHTAKNGGEFFEAAPNIHKIGDALVYPAEAAGVRGAGRFRKEYPASPEIHVAEISGVGALFVDNEGIERQRYYIKRAEG